MRTFWFFAFLLLSWLLLSLLPLESLKPSSFSSSFHSSCTFLVEDRGSSSDSVYYGTAFAVSFDEETAFLTNHHVVSEMNKPTLIDENGKEFPITFVKQDKKHDLVRFTFKGYKKYTHCAYSFKNNSLNQGDEVYTIGHPSGFLYSLNKGFVTGLDRDLSYLDDTYTYKHMIQTDLSMNEGNSGGALFNADGDVVGIVTAYLSDANNIGFAVSNDSIIQFLTKKTP